VRAQLVVGPLESIETPLLEIEVRGRGPSGAGLEGLVQAFVDPVFLGAAWRDALVGDPELEPPDVEVVEPLDASGDIRGPPRMLPVPAAAAMLDAVVAGEDIEDRAARGPGP
jgi:hypothetical protein